MLRLDTERGFEPQTLYLELRSESCGESEKGPLLRGGLPVSRWLERTRANCL